MIYATRQWTSWFCSPQAESVNLLPSWQHLWMIWKGLPRWPFRDSSTIFFAASPPKNHCKLVRCGWKMKEIFQKLCWLFWDSWIGCTSPPARWYLLELEQLSWNSESKVHFFPGGPLFIFPWTDANMELKSLANVLIQKWSHRSVEKSVAKSNTGVFFEDAAFNASTIPRHLEAGQIRCVATSK